MANLATPSSKTELAVFLLVEFFSPQTLSDSDPLDSGMCEGEELEKGPGRVVSGDMELYTYVAGNLRIYRPQKKKPVRFGQVPHCCPSSDLFQGNPTSHRKTTKGFSVSGSVDGGAVASDDDDERQLPGLPVVVMLHAAARMALCAARNIIMLPVPRMGEQCEVTKLRVSWE